MQANLSGDASNEEVIGFEFRLKYGCFWIWKSIAFISRRVKVNNIVETKEIVSSLAFDDDLYKQMK